MKKPSKNLPPGFVRDCLSSVHGMPRSRRFEARRVTNLGVEELSDSEKSCISREDVEIISDCEEVSSLPRVSVKRIEGTLVIEIITRAEWCLLSSILLALEDQNLEICSAQTFLLENKVFYTILVKVLSEVDVGEVHSKLSAVAAERSLEDNIFQKNLE